MLTLLLACATEYDPTDWKSPLAEGFSGEAEPAEGERLFYEEHWEDDTPYAHTCASCHSAEEGDTLTTDADGTLNRPGHTVYNVSWRGTWKGTETWDAAESDQLGAFGGQICVDVFFPGESEMTAEQATHLEAWLKTRATATPDGDDRAEPLDQGYLSWDTEDDFLAEAGELRGDDLGDVVAGEAAAMRHCGSCHSQGEGGALLFYSAATLTTEQLLARIRRTTVGEVEHSNSRMPRLPENRLLDADLKNILAWLTLPVAEE